MATSTERPSELKTAFDPTALNEALKKAQEAAAIAAVAREHDIARKAGRVEELVGIDQSTAKQLEEVQVIVESYKKIESQRKLVPEEIEAFGLATQAAEQLRQALTSARSEMDDTWRDEDAVGRIKDEAQAENAAYDKKQEAKGLEQIEQLKTVDKNLVAEVEAYYAEVERAVKTIQEVVVQKDSWTNTLKLLQDKVEKLAQDEEVNRLVREPLNVMDQEWDRIPAGLEAYKTSLQNALGQNTGLTKMGVRRRIEAVLNSAELADLEKEIKKGADLRQKTEKYLDEIAQLRARCSALQHQVYELEQEYESKKIDNRVRKSSGWTPTFSRISNLSDRSLRMVKELRADIEKSDRKDTFVGNWRIGVHTEDMIKHMTGLTEDRDFKSFDDFNRRHCH